MKYKIYTDGACSGNPGPGLPEHAPSVYILYFIRRSSPHNS